MPDHDTDTPHGPGGLFRTTHWSVVQAAQDGAAPQANQALETLCRSYWYPLYAFVRRRGHTVEDAQDLTQEFFSRLLQRDFLRNVGREKGRFRSFLLTALKNFLASEWRRENAAKRGGDQVIVSWEALHAEERYGGEPATEVTPEMLFEKQWALTVMEQAITRLRAEFVAAGKPAHFDQLKPYLSTEGGKAEYEIVAKALGMSPGGVSVAVHRLRKRFSELLRSVVAHTVETPDQVEDEVQVLARALGR